MQSYCGADGVYGNHDDGKGADDDDGGGADDDWSGVQHQRLAGHAPSSMPQRHSLAPPFGVPDPARPNKPAAKRGKQPYPSKTCQPAIMTSQLLVMALAPAENPSEEKRQQAREPTLTNRSCFGLSPKIRARRNDNKASNQTHGASLAAEGSRHLHEEPKIRARRNDSKRENRR